MLSGSLPRQGGGGNTGQLLADRGLTRSPGGVRTMRRPRFGLCAWLSLGLALAAGRARASDYTWSNTAGGNWGDGSNWTGGLLPNTVPGANDNALFTVAGT